MRDAIRRWAHRTGIVAIAAAAIAVVVLAPRALRQLDSFRVETVEVTGTRFMEPYAVVRAAGSTACAQLATAGS